MHLIAKTGKNTIAHHVCYNDRIAQSNRRIIDSVYGGTKKKIQRFFFEFFLPQIIIVDPSIWMETLIIVEMS